MTNSSSYAPVALFVYNRLKNTKEVVEALQRNTIAKDTELFIFSDAAKYKRNIKQVERVRSYLKTITGFKQVNLIERDRNYYIEENIISGVTEIINKYGKIIVLEDDGVSSSNFLQFMNDSLNFYELVNRVMHISAFTFINLPDHYKDKTFFWRYSENTGGGWATWRNRWDKFEYFESEQKALSSLSEPQLKKIEMGGDFKCLATLKLKPIPWDICWYMTLIRYDGLAVQSPCSMIKNNGFYNGTHFTFVNYFLGKNPFEVDIKSTPQFELASKVEESEIAIALLKEFYKNLGNNYRAKFWHFILDVLIFFRITKLLKILLKR
jgi:hypothetical protein